MKFDSLSASPASFDREFRKIVGAMSDRREPMADPTRSFVADAERASSRHNETVSTHFLVMPSTGSDRAGQYLRTDVKASGKVVTLHVVEPEQRDRPGRIGYSLFYRWCWLFMGLLALVWGLIVGASAAGLAWVDLTSAVSGIVTTIGLMVTLFVAGRRSPSRS